MDHDDETVGRILGRREVLALMGTTGAAVLVGCSLGQSADTGGGGNTGGDVAYPACIVTPELTEGPYYVEEDLSRADIRADTQTGEVSEGVPLELTLRVFEIGNGCQPLAGAVVELWQCDALGVYSGVQDRSFDTTGQNFLRGNQTTDENGEVQFTTLYPGWYRGRTVHIHFKVLGEIAGENAQFASQFFFDESVTDVVHREEPYASRGYRTVLNEQDGIYRQGGSQLLLSPTESGGTYTASFDIGLYTA